MREESNQYKPAGEPEGFQDSPEDKPAGEPEGFQDSSEAKPADEPGGFQDPPEGKPADEPEGFQGSPEGKPADEPEGFQYPPEGKPADEPEGFQGSPEAKPADEPGVFQDSPEAKTAGKAFSRGSRGGTIVIIVLFMLFLQEFLGSSCLSMAVFGIPCAGCGSSRAVQLLLQGRMREALIMHPLILLTLAFVIIIPLFMLLRFLRKKRGKKTLPPLSARAVNIFFITLALIYFVVYVVRMILYFPHTEPMLYNSNSVVGHIISFVRRLLSS